MREWITKTALSIFETMSPVLGILFIIIFVVLIPLGLFRKTRGLSALSLLIAYYIFGFAVWVYSAAVAFGLLGWFWLIVGILLAGIGVIPISIIAAIIKGYTGLALFIFLFALFSYGLKRTSMYLARKETR